MKKKFLVTGSSGFIASHLVQKLSENKDNLIYAIDKLKIKQNKSKRVNIKFLFKDLKKMKSFPKVDVVFHFAAYNGTKFFYKKPYEVIRDNIEPTINLINFYKKNPCKLFVYSGTSEVYAGSKLSRTGSDEKSKIIFNDLYNPRWSYASSKFMSEIMVINSGLDHIILRYFNIYGKNQKDHFIPEFLNRVKKKKYSLNGYKNTRCFLHIEDAIQATIKIAKIKNAKNQIFNIGSNKEYKIFDVAKKIMKILKKEKKKIKLNDPPQGSVMRRLPNVKKIKKLIGNFQSINLDSGLKKIIENKI